jgi:succinoglycan biosynthesis transport protein ExoP
LFNVLENSGGDPLLMDTSKERSLLPYAEPKPLDHKAVTVMSRSNYVASDSEGTKELNAESVLDYWLMLRRHKTLVPAFMLCGVLAGLGLGVSTRSAYRAHTSVEVLNLNEDFMNMKHTSAVTTVDTSAEVSEEQTQIKVLESESLLKRTYARLGSQSALSNAEYPANKVWWQKVFHGYSPNPLSERRKLLDQASKSLKVRATPRTRILEISIDSISPALAAAFANTFVDEYIRQNIEARWKSTQTTSNWLGRELSDARSRLQDSEAALQSYARQSGLIFANQDTNISNVKLQQIQQELSLATADRIAKQSRFELAQTVTPDSVPDVLNDPALRETGNKLNDLRREVAGLDTTYNPGYSKAKRASAELTALQAAFDHGRTAVLERIKNEYTEAARKEDLLTAAYSTQARQVTGDGERAVKYDILKREVDSNRQLYDTMLQQLQESSIASAMRASNVRVLDEAALPDVPVSPNLKVNSAVGCIAGALLGFAWMLLRERHDRTLQQPGELQFWTRLPELGTIPSARAKVLKGGSYSSRPQSSIIRSMSDERPLEERPVEERPRDNVGCFNVKDRSGLVAEAFRTVVTSILFADGHESGSRVFVLTSTETADGKTTVLSNLGITMAEAGQRVLLIDADLRRPAIHSIFGLKNDVGLADILRATSFSETAVEKVIQPSNVPGLDILTSGLATLVATKLMYSKSLALLLAKCRRDYDIVLIDTPPMLQMTDARVVARWSDGVILVARAEQTTRDAMIAANRRFAEDRIRVLGTVLNDWNPRRLGRRYYGYGHYDGRQTPALTQQS